MKAGDPAGAEGGFFGPEHAELLAPFRKRTEREAQREALAEVVRIQDPAFLDRLIAMNVDAEAALALRLIPLVFVAWADGAPDVKEREVLQRIAAERGLVSERIGRELLQQWLAAVPEPRLLERWKSEIRRVWNRFTTDEQWQMRQNILGTAREVAEAAGGFLGIGSVSAAERALLDELEALLA